MRTVKSLEIQTLGLTAALLLSRRILSAEVVLADDTYGQQLASERASQHVRLCARQRSPQWAARRSVRRASKLGCTESYVAR